MWCCAGHRLRAKARRRLLAFDPVYRLAFARMGVVHSRGMCSGLLAFVVTQAAAVFPDLAQSSNQSVYQLCIGNIEHVGRSACVRASTRYGGGLAWRWKEHVFSLFKHRDGSITKSQRRSRYFHMLFESIHSVPTIQVVCKTAGQNASALEAAIISITTPAANNLLRTFGVKVTDRGTGTAGKVRNRLTHHRRKISNRYPKGNVQPTASMFLYHCQLYDAV